jgi:hypothetical protein
MGLVFLGVRNYGYNVSTLMHMDVPFGEHHDVPSGLVLYTDGAYDGMVYYQIARDLPALITGGETSFAEPYRFQRILLPLFAYITAFGQEAAFPYSLLFINLASAIGCLLLMAWTTRKFSIHTFAVVFNPAVLVGILYSLTEPLSLFFLTVFFWRWERQNRQLDAWTILALILSLLARETTLFLIALLLVWFLWRLQWRQFFLALIPLAFQALWQYVLVLRLGSVPLETGSHMLNYPFQGVSMLVSCLTEGLTLYRLSSASLLLFVALLSIMLGAEWLRSKQRVDFYCFLLTGLIGVMLCMDAHIWGALTSIGRVVTPVYAVYPLFAAARDTRMTRMLSGLLIGLSVIAAVGIASITHPFIVS